MKLTSSSSTCLGFSSQPGGEFPAGKLIHYPQPNHQTLQATCPTLLLNPTIPLQPQWNTEAQPGTTQ